jgi:hypothetical protein
MGIWGFRVAEQVGTGLRVSGKYKKGSWQHRSAKNGEVNLDNVLKIVFVFGQRYGADDAKGRPRTDYRQQRTAPSG